MLSKWATEARCELLHKAAHSRTIQLAGHDVCVIWCYECDHVCARRLHGHEITMREDFVASSLQESCEAMADRLADTLPMDKANTVRIIGSRAELAEHNRRKAERRLARWQGLAVAFALAALCLFLSGCATPAKLKAEALRMDALGQAAERACGSACSQRQILCAKAVASALRAISEALRVQATATKYTTGALAPEVSAAIHAADEECKP